MILFQEWFQISLSLINGTKLFVCLFIANFSNGSFLYFIFWSHFSFINNTQITDLVYFFLSFFSFFFQFSALKPTIIWTHHTCIFIFIFLWSISWLDSKYIYINFGQTDFYEQIPKICKYCQWSVHETLSILSYNSNNKK